MIKEKAAKNFFLTALFLVVGGEGFEPPTLWV